MTEGSIIHKRILRILAAMAIFSLVAVACSSDDPEVEATAPPAAAEQDTTSGTLQTVLDRGAINVGVKDSQPGFGNLEPDGTFSGIDVEYGHALAAALFGDKSKVNFVTASAANQFEFLASEEIDLLIRTTT